MRRERGSRRYGVLRGRDLKLGSLSHQRNADFPLPLDVREPGAELEEKLKPYAHRIRVHLTNITNLEKELGVEG